MKYLIMIYSNPESRARWETLTPDQQLAFGREHAAMGTELAASGELVWSEALADQAAAKRVRVREGQLVATDGPFAEAKEYLAGFYLVECGSIEQALEYAAKAPDAAYGNVEVRPVLDLSTTDL